MASPRVQWETSVEATCRAGAVATRALWPPSPQAASASTAPSRASGMAGRRRTSCSTLAHVSVPANAATGFARAAGAYERTRPGYPASVVAWLFEQAGVRAGARVCDLAAGTGKLTRQLLPTGARLVAVEPVAEMRAVLARALPEVEVRAGMAEALPLDDASVDAVLVAQAFHWFDARAALDEIARVLRDGGGLGLIWNAWELDDPLQTRLDELVRRHAPPDPGEAGVRPIP